MDWHDEGVLIGVRRHGESAAIIEVLTGAHGRHAGVVPGGGGRRMAPVLQPGAQLSVTWRARVEDQIGTYRVEPIRARAAALMQDGDALAALGSVCSLLRWGLPEREAYPALYARTCDLLDALSGGDWGPRYARWELALLGDLGFGLDLSRCAVTGNRTGLTHVSPRSGRAVTAAAAGGWADRLLPLPGFLVGETAPGPGEVAAALQLTGHFLRVWVGAALERPELPEARLRLAARLAGR